MPNHYRIPILKPSLPRAEELLPWLKMIDDNQWYSNFGPLNQQFIAQLQQYFDNAFITTTSNGTSALELAISALELPQNAKVLIPALTFPATATAVIRCGLQPIIADIDENSWQLTPEIAEKALQIKRYDAIIPVATFGLPVDTNKWDNFVKNNNIPVVVDAAGAFGNQKVGENINLVFSLHATKAFSCGEGGLIVSKQQSFIEKATDCSNFGINQNTGSVAFNLASNAKMSEYHAAIGLAYLEIWQEQKKQRQLLLKKYQKQLLADIKNISFQSDIENKIISIFNVKIDTNQPIDKIAEQLNQAGVETRRWYYPLIQNHQAFKNLQQIDELKTAEKISQSIIGLPFYLGLKDIDIQSISHTLMEIINQ